ncbi:hypothetical protein JW835_05945 [bacterium]|nr:hypothetical protein [bacterium]
MHKKLQKLIFLLMVSFFISCIRDKNPTDTIIKYFDLALLDQLDIENLSGFWASDTLITKIDSDCSTAVNSQASVICVRYKCNNKHIGISVFPTQDAAISAMESIIDDVSCVIQKDTTSYLPDLYWFSDCIPNMVFTNKWNTIIEVGYYHQDFEEIKAVLYDTAFEIANRIDQLSDEF